MTQYLAGVDVGTTGVRCLLFDLHGTTVASDYREYGATYPRPGWVEQDAERIVAQTMAACKAAVTKSAVAPTEIGAIGFATQRSVTIPVDKAGKPVRPMMSWQDVRTTAEVAAMTQRIDTQEYYNTSGVPLGTPWIITKVLWLCQHEPWVCERTAKFIQVQELVLKAFGAEDYYAAAA